jgi:hypothetical protein
MPLIPDIKIRGIRTPIPSGYVLGRTVGGTGDVHLIPIDRVGGVSSASSFGSPNSVAATAASASVTATQANQLAQQALAMGSFAATNSSDGGEGDDGAPGPQGPQGVATANSLIVGMVFVFDGAGVAPAAASTCDVYVPFACTITAAVMQGDVSGSAVIDVWAKAYASTAPAVGNTIVASAPPTLSSVQNSKDTTLTGWTTAIAADSIVRASLTSASTLTRVTLTLAASKP